jgi:uncharacterized protein YuzE
VFDAEYDNVADVLYLSRGENIEATTQHATPEGHLVRYDDSGDVIGITIVNAKWLMGAIRKREEVTT